MKTILLMLMLAVPSFAESAYDYESGNHYRWNTYGNTTHIYGNNSRTGSMWDTTIQPNGSMRGMDAERNYWTYDAPTGNYHNFGTGEHCYNIGNTRQCYGR